MGGDFAVASPPPRGLTWREIEKILVRPRAAELAGWLFTTVGIVTMVVQGLLIVPLRKRCGEINLILAGTLFMTTSLVLIPLPRLVVYEFLAMALISIGNGIAGPVITSLVSQLAPEMERGEILGVFQSASSLGRIIGPFFGGQLFEHISDSAPYFTGAAIMFLSLLLALRLRDLPALRGIAHVAVES